MGGGGGQETQNTGEYPTQFQPIARGAADQILQLQGALPLAAFGQPNPGQTAGVSPFQQAAMNFIPQLLAPSWGLETLQNLGQPIGQLANNAIGVGNQTSPFSNAMTALASGGFGTGQPSFPGMAAPSPFQMQNPNMTQAAPQPNIVGGGQDLIAQLVAQLSQPIPATTPVLAGGVTGPTPASAALAAPPLPGAPGAPQAGTTPAASPQPPFQPPTRQMAPNGDWIYR